MQKAVLVCGAVSCCLQVYASYNYYFLTDWDVDMICRTAVEIADGTLQTSNSYGEYCWYYSTYPNNMELLGVFILCLKIGRIFGILSPYNGVMVFVSLNCFILTLTGYFLFDAVRRILSERWALCAWIFFTVYIGVSPWIVIPYSDSLGLIFPILELWLLCRLKTAERPWLVMAALGFVGSVGFHIKPQTAIILIAALIFYGLSFIGGSKHVKKVLLLILAFAAFSVGNAVPKAISEIVDIPLDENREFGYTHFIMMGMNPDKQGVYSQEDCDYSHSFDNQEARKNGELVVIRERVNQYGIKGILKLLNTKLLTTYSDGSFAWGLEGVFWKDVLEPKNETVSAITRAFYYRDGAFYTHFLTYMQFFWLILLALQIFSGSQDDIIVIVQLSILGLTLFELLFEARARYLYTYAPLCIFLAVCGLRNMSMKNILQKTDLS